MPPKGGGPQTRKRAASTGQGHSSKTTKSARPEAKQEAKQEAKPEAKQEAKPEAKPEPTRVSRRLRSASPSTHSPLRALSPPTRKRTTRRRKPVAIAENPEAERREEEEEQQETQTQTETQTTNDTDAVNNTQETVVNGHADEDTQPSSYDNEAEHDPASQDGPVHPSIEQQQAEENDKDEDAESEAHPDATQQSIDPTEDTMQVEVELQETVSDEPVQILEEIVEQPLAEELEGEAELANTHLTFTAQPADEVREDVEIEADDVPAEDQGTGNHLYTSKTYFPLSERDGNLHTPSPPSVKSQEKKTVAEDAEVNTPSGATGPEVFNAMPEDLLEGLSPPSRQITSELAGAFTPSNHEHGHEISRVNVFQRHLAEVSDQIRHSAFHPRRERAEADLYKVQYEAARKVEEARQIQLEQLHGEPPVSSGRARRTPRRKRARRVSDNAADESEKRPSRRAKLSQAADIQTTEVEPASQHNELEHTQDSTAISNGDYVMSGALDPSADGVDAPSESSSAPAPSEEPKTPSGRSWNLSFNPLASVKRMFQFRATPRTEPVRKTLPSPTWDPPAASKPQMDEPPPVEEDATAQSAKVDKLPHIDFTPPVRESLPVPRRRTGAYRASTGLRSAAQPDYQIPVASSTHRLPGSFTAFDEEPITPAQPRHASIPRHSFMPQTAPQPRRVQGGLQRRLQRQKQMAEAEAKRAAEAKTRQEKDEQEEIQRVRREALRARSMDVAPEVIRAAFVEKFGASARELQEYPEKGVRIGTKRKARDPSPEAIPNPSGSSYGLDETYFEEDETRADNKGEGEQSNQAEGTPSKSNDLSLDDGVGSPSIMSRLFGSLSRSAKRPRLEGPSQSPEKDSDISTRDPLDGHLSNNENVAPLQDLDIPSPSKSRRMSRRDDSSMPELRFRKDAVTGHLEPIKAGGSQQEDPQDDSFMRTTSPWYSGPFTPAKRASESPADELFRSPSVLSMKDRREFTGDFISEPTSKRNAFSSRQYQDEVDDEDDDMGDEASATPGTKQAGTDALPKTPSDVSSAIAYGQEHLCWTGPKGTGQFAVPESDSESDESDDDAEATASTSSGSKRQDLFAQSATETPGSSIFKPSVGSTNVFSKSIADTAEDSSQAQSQKQAPQEAPAKAGSEATSAAPKTPGGQSTDALARARSQAEKYKPKTPSTLRAISAMSSPLAHQDRDDAGGPPGLVPSGEGEGEDEEESGEDPGPTTPRHSPPGASTSSVFAPRGPPVFASPAPALLPSSTNQRDEADARDTNGDISSTLTDTAAQRAKEMANSISVTELPADKYASWPAPRPAPWASLIDERVTSALNADDDAHAAAGEGKKADWDAFADGIWKDALKTSKDRSTSPASAATATT